MRIAAVVVILSASLGTAFGQSATPTAKPVRPAANGFTIDAQSGSRLPLLTREDMDDDASARTYDALAGSGGTLPSGTLAIALYSPATATALGRVHDYLRTPPSTRSR
jgi:hypothetical protein